MFQFDTEILRECLSMVEQAIAAASWLTPVVRRELSRFKEFMRWLRFGVLSHRRSRIGVFNFILRDK